MRESTPSFIPGDQGAIDMVIDDDILSTIAEEYGEEKMKRRMNGETKFDPETLLLEVIKGHKNIPPSIRKQVAVEVGIRLVGRFNEAHGTDPNLRERVQSKDIDDPQEDLFRGNLGRSQTS